MVFGRAKDFDRADKLRTRSEQFTTNLHLQFLCWIFTYMKIHHITTVLASNMINFTPLGRELIVLNNFKLRALAGGGAVYGAMLARPRPMCPPPKILGCCAP
jgi:hypothetical protein